MTAITIEQKAKGITISAKAAKGIKLSFAEKNILTIYNKKLAKIAAENGQKR